MKIVKILGGLLLALILCAAAAVVALKVFFPPAKLKSLAIEKIEPAIGRKLKIGDISIGLGGVKAKSIEVSEIPDFKAGTMLKAGEAGVSLKWLPLLQKRAEVSEIALKDFDIVVGASQGAGAPSSAGSPAAGAGAGAAAFSVGRIRLDNGRFAYKEGGKVAHELTKIKADASGIRPQGPWPAAFSFDFASGGKKGRLKFKGSIDLGGLDQKKMKVEAKPLELDYAGAELELNGTAAPLSSPKVAGEFKLGKLAPRQLADLGLAMITESAPLKGRIDVEPLNGGWRVKELALESQGSIGIKPLPKSMPLALRLAGSVGRSHADLKKLDLELGKLSVESSGEVSFPDGKPLTLSLSVQTNQFPLAEFLPADAPIKPQGLVKLRARVAGPAASPALTGEASISGGKFVFEGQDIQKLEAEAKLTPDAASFKTSGSWNGAAFKLDVSAKDYRKVPVVRIDGSLSELDLAKFDQGGSDDGASEDKKTEGGKNGEKSAPFKSSGKITIGKITHPNFNAAPADMQWDLSKGNHISKLNGTAKLKVGSGKFDNLKTMGERSGLVKALLLPIIVVQKVGAFAKVPLLPAFDRVQFKEITGDYVFENGVMTIKESHMDSSMGYVTASGSADLVKDQIKMRVQTKIGASVGPKLSGPIGFTVTGSLSDPSVKPDVAAILKQPVVNDAVEQGKKLLEDIFKKR